MKYLFVKYRIA